MRFVVRIRQVADAEMLLSCSHHPREVFERGRGVFLELRSMMDIPAAIWVSKADIRYG